MLPQRMRETAEKFTARSDAVTLQDRIERFLLRGKATASNLALALGRRQYDIEAVLNRMERSGTAFMAAKGAWSLYAADTEKQEPCSPSSPAQSDTVVEKKRPTRSRKSDTPTRKPRAR